MNPVKNSSGMISLLALAFLSAALILFCSLFRLSFTAKEKIRLQIATDLALISILNIESNTLNSIAIGNRAVLAHEPLTAQANALVSESVFNRKLLDGFSGILNFLPGYGVVLSEALARGGRLIETFLKKTASVLIPTACTLNRILEQERKILLKKLPFAAIMAAREALNNSDPGARIIIPSQLNILKRINLLTNRIIPASNDQIRALVWKTLDRHTKNRNWQFGSGIISLPFRKYGGSRLTPLNYFASDVLKIKKFVFFGKKWKTAISAGSSATDFRYRNASRILLLKHSGLPVSQTLLARKELSSIPAGSKGRLPTLTAVSSGTIFFSRPGKPDEQPNILNPFWQSRLIPVSQESSARKIMPRALLLEIRH